VDVPQTSHSIYIGDKKKTFMLVEARRLSFSTGWAFRSESMDVERLPAYLEDQRFIGKPAAS
jgi:hypothetical protein